MKISKEQIQYIFQQNPETVGSNTNFLIAFYETVCLSREIPATWENIKAIMSEYKPEFVTRKRREYAPSTEEQLDKEVEMHEEYSPSNPSKG